MIIEEIKKEVKEQKTFYKTKTPKNLIVLIKLFILGNMKEKKISKIDFNDYTLKREDEETIKLVIADRVVKVCFIDVFNIYQMYKEV